MNRLAGSNPAPSASRAVAAVDRSVRAEADDRVRRRVENRAYVSIGQICSARSKAVQERVATPAYIADYPIQGMHVHGGKHVATAGRAAKAVAGNTLR